MSLHAHRPWREIQRRKSRQIMVGRVPVGGDAPISVQTMTNTDTTDVRATLDQIIRAADAGAGDADRDQPGRHAATGHRPTGRAFGTPRHEAAGGGRPHEIDDDDGYRDAIHGGSAREWPKE